MIIDEKMIKDIFSLKIKVTDKNKKILSQYEEYIPMYDIYSQQIYPIYKKNLHYRLIESHYRFITDEIRDWMKKKYDDYKNDKIKSEIFKKNLQIIDNYNLYILSDTSYKVLYKYSKSLGLQVSICKRKSFSPYLKHLKPYYTKNELIKLGENMNIIKESIELENLNDKQYHYNVCKKISENDVSFYEIKNQSEEIIDKNLISWVTFYSFIGSFIFNYHLRNLDRYMNTQIYNGLKKIVNIFKTSKPLDKEYIFYRFLWDDTFIKYHKIGDIISDNGFTSTTRDPFYSPGLNGTFGLILIKIHVPKNVSGIGYFIENFSFFPSEEEFLISPFSEFKLISKNDNFKYFHTNESFEKLINKKYELEYVGTKFNKIDTYRPVDKIKIIDIKKYESRGCNKLEMIKNFIEDNNQINIKLNNKVYKFLFQWFDGTDVSSYSKLYANKVKEGIIFNVFDDDGYPYINIELGNELVVNYTNMFYYYKDKKEELTDEILELIYHFGKTFYYREAKIYQTYRNFSQFINNNSPDLKIFIYNNFYNHSIYNFIKNKNREFENNNYIKYEIGWYNLNFYMDKTIPDEIITKLKLKYKTVKENFIDIVENNFLIYNNFIKEITEEKEITNIYGKYFNILTQNYYTYSVVDRLRFENKEIQFKKISYSDNIQNEMYSLIYKQPIRRF